ncbi:MAG: hypothetical protein PVG65_01055 [Candidatus Thorarchaeota archaeon]|jgi:hypothetical protein
MEKDKFELAILKVLYDFGFIGKQAHVQKLEMNFGVDELPTLKINMLGIQTDVSIIE